MSNYRFFDVIKGGDLFDALEGEDYVDVAETHRHRDSVLLSRINMYAECLRSDLMDVRKIADDLHDLVTESSLIDQEIGFGYENKKGER